MAHLTSISHNFAERLTTLNLRSTSRHFNDLFGFFISLADTATPLFPYFFPFSDIDFLQLGVALPTWSPAYRILSNFTSLGLQVKP